MRSVMAKFAMVVAILVASAAFLPTQANADSGSPMPSTDGRYAPNTGDRLVVYCNADNVTVWGIDTASNGLYLTTFSVADLLSKTPVSYKTAEGTVTLTLDASAAYSTDYSDYSATTLETVVSTGAQYHVTWVGGDFGADGSAAFVKNFSCTYQG
jgi:hypothetical protein